MTREEAITVFKAFMDNPLFSDVHKAAFNIAIHDIKQRHDWDINNLVLINKDNYEPLEQEPCEDCISRQAVINGIDNYIEKVQSTGAKDDFISFEELVVKVLPPVTPKPKTDMLDKIRAEIETKFGQCDICEYFENYDYEENDISEYRPIGNITDILQIIDKYRAESEARNDTNSTADL